MDELIPILIAIIWLIYTFYNRGQKQKKKQAVLSRQNDQKETQKRELSVLEKILLGEELETALTYKTIDDQDYERMEEEYPENKKVVKPFLKEEISAFLKEGEAAIVNKEDLSLLDEDLQLEANDDLRDFHLRKAVIYSAILETPYIGYK